MDRSRLNFRSFLEEAVAEVPSQPYLIWTGTDQALSYADFDASVNRAASAWRELGVKPGDRVAFMLDNSPGFLIAWLGLAKIAGVLVAINTGFRQVEAEYLVSDSEAVLALVAEEHLSIFESLPGRLPGLRAVLTLDEVNGYQSFTAASAQADSRAPSVTPGPDDLISLIYTSGTTGNPKGVMQTHANFVLTGQSYPTWMDLAPGDRIYACLPLFHINSQAYSTMGAIGIRGSLVLSPRFSASRFWPEVRKHRVNVFNYIGAMTVILAKKEVTPGERDHSVKVAYGVPALNEETRLAVEERFGLTIISGFGMSETTFGLAEKVGGERRPASMGTVRNHPDPSIARTQARIVDDHGKEVPAGTTGELLLKNAAMMTGYFRDPERTAEALQDGWLHTGDSAWQDADGFFYFVDRLKDIVRRRGENISSLEVERVIEQHPAVAEAAVVGVPSELTDEDVLAYVVCRGEVAVTPEELIDWCLERLARFKVPRYMEFVDGLPKTPTAKVQKTQLRGRPAGDRFDSEARDGAV